MNHPLINTTRTQSEIPFQKVIAGIHLHWRNGPTIKRGLPMEAVQGQQFTGRTIGLNPFINDDLIFSAALMADYYAAINDLRLRARTNESGKPISIIKFFNINTHNKNLSAFSEQTVARSEDYVSGK